jgi:hypothetical protein
MKTAAALLFSLTLSLSAGEKLAVLKLTDGTELHDVEIRGLVEEGVKVTHRNGGGTLPPSKLPADLAKQHDAYVSNLMKEREAQRLKSTITDHKTVTGPAVLSAVCPSVKEVGGELGGGRFRYFVTFRNNTGTDMEGAFKVSTENGEGVVNHGAVFNVTMQNGAARTGFFNMHTAPPVRHGDAGVTKLRWTFTDSTGKTTSGDCPVPNEIKER